jgi:hypothetical protein
MSILNFPTKLPTPGQLELPRALAAEALHELTRDLMDLQLEILRTSSAAEFAAAARKAADKLSAASLGWTSMVGTIRDSWGIKGGT